MDGASQRSSYFPSGVLLGIGLGGFFDGIVLHQLLQWHHMFTSTGRWSDKTVHDLEVNTLGDGLFHASTWIFTVGGLVLLWRAGRRPHPAWSTRAFVGTLLLGWGVFNMVEGVINHQLLGIHHVRDDSSNQLAWDLAYLAWGGVMIVTGWILSRTERTGPVAEAHVVAASRADGDGTPDRQHTRA